MLRSFIFLFIIVLITYDQRKKKIDHSRVCDSHAVQSEDGIDQGVTLVYLYYTKQRIGIKIEANADLLVVGKEA
jgi:hypothetical protein